MYTQTLVAPPGTTYHHSNIGWNLAGLVAAKASGKPLPLLYRKRLFQPLRLSRTAYDPQGRVSGAHAKGYALAANGTLTDTTAWHLGKGRRRDRYRRQRRGDVPHRPHQRHPARLKHPRRARGGRPSGCGGPFVHIGSGAGDGFKSDVVYAVDGSSVAVLLLNGRTPGETGFARSAAAANSLYCAA